MKVFCQLLLKLIGVSAGGEPELQGAVHQVHHLLLIVNSGRIGDPVSRGKLLCLVMEPVCIFSHHGQDLFPGLGFCLIFKHLFFPPFFLSRLCIRQSGGFLARSGIKAPGSGTSLRSGGP